MTTTTFDKQQQDFVANVAADVVGYISAYEEGRLDIDDTIALFAYLIRSRIITNLQGSYQRAASMLVREGIVSHTGLVNFEQLELFKDINS